MRAGARQAARAPAPKMRQCLIRVQSRLPGKPERCFCARESIASHLPGPIALASSLQRRQLLSSFFPSLVLAGVGIGTDDPTTLLNAVLSGYGLPMLKGNDQLKVYDEFENDWLLAYPRSWVARNNTLRSGFYVSNFQTADKATVEAVPLPAGWAAISSEEQDMQIISLAVKAAVVPGSEAGQADDKLSLPSTKSIKSEVKSIDGKRYIYLTFPSETLTRSGYNVRRRHWAVVAVSEARHVAYTLSASAASAQYNKDKEALLRSIVESFRIR
ncbi:hypothetical protein V8C86DRAFT_2491546 [Haematococcus lacustris]